MASSSKVQKFDSEGLENLKKSLICYYCKRPPRPGKDIYVHDGNCHPEIVTCDDEDCVDRACPDEVSQRLDPNLTKFASAIKLWNCSYQRYGCLEEIGTKDLEAHEKICLFREVSCPECEEEISFNGIMDHYQEKHSKDLKIVEDVLEFKGTIRELRRSTYILNKYGKPFFVQFAETENNGRFEILHVWVVGHGDQAEMNLFEMSVDFFLNGKPKISIKDYVKELRLKENDDDSFAYYEYEDEDLCNGEGNMMINVKNITQFYDVQSKEFKDQEFIELQMKIVSEKLDEVAKDVNVESGVEDSETEEN